MRYLLGYCIQFVAIQKNWGKILTCSKAYEDSFIRLSSRKRDNLLTYFNKYLTNPDINVKKILKIQLQLIIF